VRKSATASKQLNLPCCIKQCIIYPPPPTNTVQHIQESTVENNDHLLDAGLLIL